MAQPEPCSVVRIAIALVILKHKPRDHSITSYLLDLQSRFPLATNDKDSRDWRTYALELEKQLALVKAQRDADQELLSRLQRTASQAASTSDAPPPKKKSKKNPTKDQHDLERGWDQSRADWSRILSSQYPSPPSLVAAYTSLKGAFASPNADLVPYTSRLADAILHALDTIHVFLFSPPNPPLDLRLQTTLGAPEQLKPEHVDSTRIALMAPLLTYVLRTTLPALLHAVRDSTKSKRPRLGPPVTMSGSVDVHARVDKVLDRLLECALLPLLRALAPLCLARLAPLLSPPLKKDKVGRPVGKAKDKDKNKNKNKSVGPPTSGPLTQTSDVRTDVFALIATSFEALDALPPVVLVRPSVPLPTGGASNNIARGIRDRLGLETIRELEALYAVPTPPQPPSQPPSATAISSEPPPLTPTPTPTSLSVPSRPQSQSQSQLQSQSHVPLHSHPPPRTRPGLRSQSESPTTRTDRVRVLATKHAGWFLASTLHLCVSPVPVPMLTTSTSMAALAPATGKEQERAALALTPIPAPEPAGGLGLLLREALLDRIGKLVRSLPSPGPGGRLTLSEDRPSLDLNPGQVGPDRPRGVDSDALPASAAPVIDPVCQHMLLAVCERALSQLAPPQ